MIIEKFVFLWLCTKRRLIFYCNGACAAPAFPCPLSFFKLSVNVQFRAKKSRPILIRTAFEKRNFRN